MDKSFVQKAKNIITEAHEELQAEVNNNIRKAKSNAEFNQLNTRKRELLWNLGKSLGDNDTAKAISEELKDITDKQSTILKSIGLTFDDLKVKNIMIQLNFV